MVELDVDHFVFDLAYLPSLEKWNWTFPSTFEDNYEQIDIFGVMTAALKEDEEGVHKVLTLTTGNMDEYHEVKFNLFIFFYYDLTVDFIFR